MGNTEDDAYKRMFLETVHTFRSLIESLNKRRHSLEERIDKLEDLTA